MKTETAAAQTDTTPTPDQLDMSVDAMHPAPAPAAAAKPAARKTAKGSARKVLPALNMVGVEEDKYGVAEQLVAALFDAKPAQLVDMLASDLTVADIARYALASRGLSIDGTWIGFDKAAARHDIAPDAPKARKAGGR